MKILNENQSLMRETIGKHEEFSIAVTPLHEPVIEFNNGKKYVIEWSDIFQLVANVEKELANTKEKQEEKPEKKEK